MKRSGFTRKAPATSEGRLSARLRKRLVEQGLLDAPKLPRHAGWPAWMPRELWDDYYMSENEWQGTLVDWAYRFGGYTYHLHLPNLTNGTKGWYDLCILGAQPAIFVELKVRSRDGRYNKPKAHQEAVIYAGIKSGLSHSLFWSWPDDAVVAWELLTKRPWADCPYAQELQRYA